jgi:TRAP-type mannitol/chloroaromatic compound transport system substrate-binding protein
MDACYKASVELYDEISAQNPKFKKVYESWKLFRDDQFAWFKVCETNYDNFTFSVAERLKL